MSKRLRRVRLFLWIVMPNLLIIIFLFPPSTYFVDFDEIGELCRMTNVRF